MMINSRIIEYSILILVMLISLVFIFKKNTKDDLVIVDKIVLESKEYEYKEHIDLFNDTTLNYEERMYYENLYNTKY